MVLGMSRESSALLKSASRAAAPGPPEDPPHPVLYFSIASMLLICSLSEFNGAFRVKETSEVKWLFTEWPNAPRLRSRAHT